MRFSKFGFRVGTTLLCSGLLAGSAFAAPFTPDTQSDVVVSAVEPIDPGPVQGGLSLTPFTAAEGKVGTVSYAYNAGSGCIGVALGGGSGVDESVVQSLLQSPTMKAAKKFRNAFLLLLCNTGGKTNATLMNTLGVKEAVKAELARKTVKGKKGSVISVDLDTPGLLAKVDLVEEQRFGGATVALVQYKIVVFVDASGQPQLFIMDTEGGKAILYGARQGAFHTDWNLAAKAVFRNQIQSVIDNTGAPELIMRQ